MAPGSRPSALHNGNMDTTGSLRKFFVWVQGAAPLSRVCHTEPETTPEM